MTFASVLCGGGCNPKIKRKRRKEQVEERSWIEQSFHKRECSRFVPTVENRKTCCCGHDEKYHNNNGVSTKISKSPTIPGFNRGENKWSSVDDTKMYPTDAFGTIEFQGLPHPTKAEYVRLAHDTLPEPIVSLLCQEWNLGLPKLLITVHGGRKNFQLQPTLKKVLRKGLLRAAKTTGAWTFTTGIDTGVARQVGDALLLDNSQRQGRPVSIGIAPWGILDEVDALVNRGKEISYEDIAAPWSKNAGLNKRHTSFLLVDNGTRGKFGSEITLRRKLEKYISTQQLRPYTHSSIPVIALVIEGGENTIHAVYEYVTDDPPVPVVVCDGTGRAANLISFMHEYCSDDGTLAESSEEQLLETIETTFIVSPQKARRIYDELVQCVKRKHLITIFKITEDRKQELDQIILTALFESKQLSPGEQLSLSLIWNRPDIARSKILVDGQKWQAGILEQAMMQALKHDRTDFVKLLLEYGVSMRKFLTIPRLEELYNTNEGPSNTLAYILRDVRPQIAMGEMYTLYDVGLVINKLMGGAYSSRYTQKKFRSLYSSVMKKNVGGYRSFGAASGRAADNVALNISSEVVISPVADAALFEFPFNEILIWAVLTKRQRMALLLWQHGEEALAKALVSFKLYKAMAQEAAEDDLESEVSDELRKYGKEFENMALEVLDYCYQQDDDQAQQLLTAELLNWSSQTCLSLAVTANHRSLLAHPCSQTILADLWMAGLRMRKNTTIKVIFALICPFYIPRLDFKSREELQLMPQTPAEYATLIAQEDENEDSESEHNGQAEMDVESHGGSQRIVHRTSVRRRRKTLISDDGAVADPGEQQIVQVTSMTDRYYPRDYKVLSEIFNAKTGRPLGLRKKLYEFYTAPITKFYANALAYLVFLAFYCLTIILRMKDGPRWHEWYSVVFIFTLGCEKTRELVTSEPVKFSHKFKVWCMNVWNPFDALAILFFSIGFGLRWFESTFDLGRLIYCVGSSYWILRFLSFLAVNKYLGPFTHMIRKMVKHMLYFVILLVVILLCYSLPRISILHPRDETNWSLIADIFLEPYFMLYGEVYADKIYPPCNEVTKTNCQYGREVSVVLMIIYLLFAYILLINLMLAVFNNIFQETNANAHEVWMFQRYAVIMEYEQKPVCPPPFIIFSYMFTFIRYLWGCLKKRKTSSTLVRDNGLKLFLDEGGRERLCEFEEDCVEGYFQEKELKLQNSAEERNKVMYKRLEKMQQAQDGMQESLVSLRINVEETRSYLEEKIDYLINLMSLNEKKDDNRMRRPSESSEATVGNNDFQVQQSIIGVRHRRQSKLFLAANHDESDLEEASLSKKIPNMGGSRKNRRTRSVSENAVNALQASLSVQQKYSKSKQTMMSLYHQNDMHNGRDETLE